MVPCLNLTHMKLKEEHNIITYLICNIHPVEIDLQGFESPSRHSETNVPKAATKLVASLLFELTILH